MCYAKSCHFGFGRQMTWHMSYHPTVTMATTDDDVGWIFEFPGTTEWGLVTSIRIFVLRQRPTIWENEKSSKSCGFFEFVRINIIFIECVFEWIRYKTAEGQTRSTMLSCRVIFLYSGYLRSCDPSTYSKMHGLIWARESLTYSDSLELGYHRRVHLS